MRYSRRAWSLNVSTLSYCVNTCVPAMQLFRLFAFWGVGVVFEAPRGSWTVSWNDDRTQELASGASSTKTRTQFGYPNFVQHPKTLQFQQCDFNV